MTTIHLFIIVFLLSFSLISGRSSWTQVGRVESQGSGLPDLCEDGPSFWCIPGENNVENCKLERVKNVGVCGYSSRMCHTVPNIETFCKTNPKARTFGGGLTNLPAGYFGWLLLAFYWPPSFCSSYPSASSSSFCSDYTTVGHVASHTLQLHGLWPNFGPEQGGSTGNLPEGWSEYCSPELNPGGSNSHDYSKCHVSGGLCPEKIKKTQFHYDLCMAKYGVEPCATPLKVLQVLGGEFKTSAAGYMGSNGSLLIHEFTKHGSCIGGPLTARPLEFFSVALERAQRTRERSAAAILVEKNKGKVVSWKLLHAAMGNMATALCSSKCHLQELWYCYGKEGNGYPSKDPIECGPSHLASDTCNPHIRGSRNCTTIIIPQLKQQFRDLVTMDI